MLSFSFNEDLDSFSYLNHSIYPYINNKISLFNDPLIMKIRLTWRGETSCEGISGKIQFASADGAVVHDSAIRVSTTAIRTRVCTFLIDASFVQRTF